MHHETKEMPVYALVVAKSGSKLKEAPPAPPDGGMPPPGPPTGQMRRGGIRMGRGELTASAIPLDRLEDVLSRITARPVLNRTGLQGVYDFTLKWTPAEGEGPIMGGPGGPAVRCPQTHCHLPMPTAPRYSRRSRSSSVSNSNRRRLRWTRSSSTTWSGPRRTEVAAC
jgi:uncharacterized protein (TIGR03435 family)